MKNETPHDQEILSLGYPELISEWDFDKNAKLCSPNETTYKSSKKVWWKCKEGHEWQAIIRNRTIIHSGCPYCSGRKAIKGENDILTLYPHLAEEWDFEKNVNIKPDEISGGSNKRIWWRCSKCGNSYQAMVNNRASHNTGCPYCAGKKSVIGKTDINTLYPNLIKEWNYAKNGDLSPQDFTPGSEKKVWWTCSYGHDYFSTICGRVKGNGCPFCSGRQAITGKNDLLTIRPDIAEEWDYDKNVEKRPEHISAQSGIKVWWKCSLCGFSWKTTPAMRTGQDTGCPNCLKHRKTSFPEQAIYYYIQKVFPDTINSYTDTLTFGNRMELDIYIPSISTGIEYDGVYWHKNEKKELEKYNICKAKGIRLIRVKENYSKKSFDIAACDHLIQRKTNDDIGLNICIQNVLSLLCPQQIDIDINADRSIIKSRYIISFKENSLAAKYPNIAAEWDFDKNHSLTPTMITSRSGDKVWWKCSTCGQSYYTSPDKRIGRGVGCPYCSGRNAIPGVNDFALTYPDVASSWNYNKNKDLVPSGFKSGSDKKVWWICENGHEWQETIYKRTIRGFGCPYCSGQRIIPGETDLSTLFPDITKEWDYKKNIDIDPCSCAPHSGQKVWWICKNGHEWKTSIASRTSGRTGCPICSGRVVLSGFNDLAHLRPDITADWDHQKNIDIKPSQVTLHSNKSVWWICNHGHEWKMPIIRRTLQNCGCPYCANKKILAGFNDLKTTNPDIAMEWDEEKNKEMNPTSVGSGSHYKAWWKCHVCGYSWQAVIYSRTGKKAHGCPMCAKDRMPDRK